MDIYNNLNSYHNNQSYIFDKNDFSNLSKNKLNCLSLNDLSFDDYNNIKFKPKTKYINSSKFNEFKQMLEKTFTNPKEDYLNSINYQIYDSSIIEKNLSNKILPVNSLPENKRSKSTNKKFNSSTNSTINLHLNNNYNKNIKNKRNNNINNNNKQQNYVNKNYNKVFGNNISDKTFRILYKISKIKKNLKNVNRNKETVNRPKIEIKEQKILNEYNDNTVSIHKKINNLMKPHKRNLSNLEDYNNRNNFINKSFHKTNIFKNNKNRINSISNFTNYKNNIVKVAFIDLFNDNINDPQKEIEVYKNSFKVNKSKDFIIQKYLNNSKKK